MLLATNIKELQGVIVMSHGKSDENAHHDYHNVEENAELVLKFLNSYYRTHNHSGKLCGGIPDFFLVKPEFLDDKEIAMSLSDKILIKDCIQRANERGGYVCISKHLNIKLDYYWLELSVMPFMLGDTVTDDNKGNFFKILANFIDYTKLHPGRYGNLIDEIDSDKDLALMLKEVNIMASRLNEQLKYYPENMLLSFNQNWPVAEVTKLLHSLKENDQGWCEVFFEYLIYVMGKKSKR